jgi:hypothetical protein
MRTIYKYPLEAVDEQTITTKANYKILTVAVQNEQPCLWIEVDTEKDDEDIKIFTHGTGHPLFSEANNYIGSYQLHKGSLVFHVYKE